MAISQPNKLHPNAKDLTGKKFGRLLVIEFAGVRPPGRLLWSCQCDCGTIKVICGIDMACKNTKSCGCLNRENMLANAAVQAKRLRTHGMERSPEYTAWRAMLRRCQNPAAANYDIYGGRGITVCEQWTQSFQNFYADMGPKPSAGHSVDRKDNSLGYTPDNCRWATAKEQASNRRSNVRLVFDGKTLTISEWSEIIHINRQTICERIKRGWPIEKVLSRKRFPRPKASP